MYIYILLGFLTGGLRRGRPSCYARLGPSHICVEGRKVESPPLSVSLIGLSGSRSGGMFFVLVRGLLGGLSVYGGG